MVQHGQSQGQARAPSQRQLRVGELIRHALAEILARGELMDDEVTRMMVTVPEVRVSPDLRNATVYITPLGGGEPKQAEKAMARNARWLRGQVAHRVNLKFAPDLTFRYDDRFDETAHIDAILHSPDVARDLDESDRDDQRDDKDE
ncbi:30S ribosome-binding factor RbfA [Pleomorphomonas diazotrophica]|uniref:Ribosome-binding factor A n=1 Tax=Pleomorphomonas diazotrophica TaxID=1166257 RepID=A0A1I4T5L5_9HYPH|nr:30S ribosome-binding factor RbfA [Pleomorphomonas diazotrophica]PKR89546.1 30S ribosome-binding factor RbfA [Pleomorphomonas diazotrophica]SFM72012.1 ribosome-binding factor A [Pleomorphomonas diazotrophica]